MFNENTEDQSSLFKDEDSWKDSYIKFQQEAIRWDSRKLISVFGDANPIEPLDDSRILSDRQKLLVGEFLRRNHARLAHEIAINGVPGTENSKNFHPFSTFPLTHRDLYGFLARSHNLSVRDAADRIPRIKRRRYLDIHAPYIMTLLRIADYIQIDAARAPTQILQLRGLRSPISRQEWAKHHDVLELHQLGDDPEALNVIASPKNIIIFSGLRALFRDLQRELDESWALLGEVYGRVHELNSLGLTVRRLISNLDNPLVFEKENSLKYVPKEIRLTTSSAELLRILVGPLYGNRPTIGVRELLQNSIDATLEMQNQLIRKNSANDYNPSVEVEVDLSNENAAYVRVTDNGVGMTLQTLSSFFLTAGASFRRSAWWSKEYIDSEGRAQVRRSGRFGVGALAAFLIGPKITVTTRHFLDETGSGLRLSFSLDDDLIEVSRIDCGIGTSVEVKINDPLVTKQLLNANRFRNDEIPFYDWYVYPEPKIVYRTHIDAKWSERNPPWVTPQQLLSPDGIWSYLESQDFESIFWTYDRIPDTQRSIHGFLICNGILIRHSLHDENLPKFEISTRKSPFRAAHPRLLVNDRDGRLPLNVQRDGLAESEYPFQDSITKSIAELYVRDIHRALCIEATPLNINEALKGVRSVIKKYIMSSHHVGGVASIGLTQKGWIPMEPTLLEKNLPSCFIFEMYESISFDGFLANLDITAEPNSMLVPIVVDSTGGGIALTFFRSLLDSDYLGSSPAAIFARRIAGLRIFVSSAVNDNIFRKGGLPQFLLRRLNKVFENDRWFVYESDSPHKSDNSIEEIIKIADDSNARVFAYAYTSDGQSMLEETPFQKAWTHLVVGTFVT